ncbi:hypothetical protein AVEN_13897-1 [Araneus ventricosus]|uniref:RNA-directed DNA polymerase n=1 Tax=Araneus ventricosus TaxID=182803 RepID=A0A4Y2MKN9_ARAVE|nr:hypothetical protein AVEN_13897-1 [Araneus ventricosus]
MDTELFCDVSNGRCRPFVPKEFTRRIFETLHNLSHPGVKTTVKLVGDRFLWPGYNKDVAKWDVVVYLVGEVKSSAIRDIKVETAAFEFYANWIARFGVLERLTFDQGRRFESQLFREFARLLGVKVVHTTPYHPQANGSVERLHRQLKSAIRAHATERWTLDGDGPSILFRGTSICERTVKLFSCGDGNRLTKSMVPPYSGPDPVVSRATKHFAIQVDLLSRRLASTD